MQTVGRHLGRRGSRGAERWNPSAQKSISERPPIDGGDEICSKYEPQGYRLKVLFLRLVDLTVGLLAGNSGS
jgi:hypothetical protein